MTSFTRPSHARPRGFTMIELLVVIGIIVLLAAILVPVVSQVRMQGYKATTTGEMQRIMQACLNYYHDFNSYPGPLANSQVVPQASGAAAVNMKPTATSTVTPVPNTITSSENLVLGLLGLLTPSNAQTDNTAYYAPPPPQHDVESLNYLHPATYHYIDYVPEELTPGFAFANFGETGVAPFQYPTDYDPTISPKNQAKGETITDSQIPEFQDHIPDAMPILYLKAYTGTVVGPPTGVSGVVSNNATLPQPAQFNFAQLLPYGFTAVSQNDFVSGGKSIYTNLIISGSPSDQATVSYFLNPNIAGQPRGKDSFILISAGADRMYGTADDIIVAP